jgi:hypothetical protein
MISPSLTLHIFNRMHKLAHDHHVTNVILTSVQVPGFEYRHQSHIKDKGYGNMPLYAINFTQTEPVPEVRSWTYLSELLWGPQGLGVRCWVPKKKHYILKLPTSNVHFLACLSLPSPLTKWEGPILLYRFVSTNNKHFPQRSPHSTTTKASRGYEYTKRH